MPGWLGMGKPVDISFSFVVLAYSGHISCGFLHFVLLFSLGFFWAIQRTGFGGGKLYGGNHTFSKYANHTSFRLLISHTYLAGSSYVRFYALLLTGFRILRLGGWGWGWGLDTIINGLLFFSVSLFYLLLVDFVVDLLFQIPCSYIILFLTSFFGCALVSALLLRLFGTWHGWMDGWACYAAMRCRRSGIRWGCLV